MDESIWKIIGGYLNEQYHSYLNLITLWQTNVTLKQDDTFNSPQVVVQRQKTSLFPSYKFTIDFTKLARTPHVCS